MFDLFDRVVDLFFGKSSRNKYSSDVQFIDTVSWILSLDFSMFVVSKKETGTGGYYLCTLENDDLLIKIYYSKLCRNNKIIITIKESESDEIKENCVYEATSRYANHFLKKVLIPALDEYVQESVLHSARCRVINSIRL